MIEKLSRAILLLEGLFIYYVITFVYPPPPPSPSYKILYFLETPLWGYPIPNFQGTFLLKFGPFLERGEGGGTKFQTKFETFSLLVYAFSMEKGGG